MYVCPGIVNSNRHSADIAHFPIRTSQLPPYPRALEATESAAKAFSLLRSKFHPRFTMPDRLSNSIGHSGPPDDFSNLGKRLDDTKVTFVCPL